MNNNNHHLHHHHHENHNNNHNQSQIHHNYNYHHNDNHQQIGYGLPYGVIPTTYLQENVISGPPKQMTTILTGEAEKHRGPSLTQLERQVKIARFLQKRKRRVWKKKISYECRKRVADKRVRWKGRFVRKDDAEKLLNICGGKRKEFELDKEAAQEVNWNISSTCKMYPEKAVELGIVSALKDPQPLNLTFPENEEPSNKIELGHPPKLFNIENTKLFKPEINLRLKGLQNNSQLQLFPHNRNIFLTNKTVKPQEINTPLSKSIITSTDSIINNTTHSTLKKEISEEI